MSCLPSNFHSSSTCRQTYALPYVPLNFPPHHFPPPAPLPTATPPPLGPSSLIPSSQIPAIAHTSVSIAEISSPEGLYSDPFIVLLPSPALPLHG
jgi:hypothetical protein